MQSDPVGSRYVLDRAASRDLDRLAVSEFGIPSIVLMENASRALAEAALGMIGERCAMVIAGPGANGGDGFACARHLHNARIEVRVVLSGKRDRVRGDARVNLDILTAMGIEIEVPERVVDALGEGDLIIDALLGTGLDRPVEGPLADVIDGVNRARDRGARVLSADLPSGLDADSGEVLGCAVDADLTVCFGAWKPGLLARAGQVVVGGIGAPRELIERLGRPIDAGQA